MRRVARGTLDKGRKRQDREDKVCDKGGGGTSGSGKRNDNAGAGARGVIPHVAPPRAG